MTRGIAYHDGLFWCWQFQGSCWGSGHADAIDWRLKFARRWGRMCKHHSHNRPSHCQTSNVHPTNQMSRRHINSAQEPVLHRGKRLSDPSLRIAAGEQHGHQTGRKVCKVNFELLDGSSRDDPKLNNKNTVQLLGHLATVIRPGKQW